jgi:hypothetical protein
MRLTKNVGFLLLGLWLIIWGVVSIAGLGTPTVNAVLAVLALVAGIFILLGR